MAHDNGTITIQRFLIIDIFLENPIMIHHDISLNKMPVKRLSASFISLLKSKLLENSKKKLRESILKC